MNERKTIDLNEISFDENTLTANLVNKINSIIILLTKNKAIINYRFEIVYLSGNWIIDEPTLMQPKRTDFNPIFNEKSKILFSMMPFLKFKLRIQCVCFFF